MLAVQIPIILVWKFEPIASWWVFVLTLLIQSVIYLWRVSGNRWRTPERLAAVMAE